MIDLGEPLWHEITQARADELPPFPASPGWEELINEKLQEPLNDQISGQVTQNLSNQIRELRPPPRPAEIDWFQYGDRPIVRWPQR